ncbi:Auxin response factor 9, partial [Bienertia sinuspersici]
MPTEEVKDGCLIMLQLLVFKIQAEPDTDEVYAQVMLVPECVHIILSSMDDDMFFEASSLIDFFVCFCVCFCRICLAIHLHKSWWPRIYMEMNGVSGIYFG